MCYVIITCNSMLWTLLSITCFMMVLASVTSPHWLIGYSRRPGLVSTKNISYVAISPEQEAREEEQEEEEEGYQDVYNPTIGIFNRCSKLHHFQFIPKRENCATYVEDFLTDNSQFPDTWKAALVLFGCAGVLLLMTSLAAVLSLCVRSVFGKSIFTLSGLVQCVAGLLCILGLILYPAGWGSAKVKTYCGQHAGPFEIDRCQLGWSFFLCIVGTLLTFLCGVLSIKADSSTSSHKVEEEVLEGKNLICVL